MKKNIALILSVVLCAMSLKAAAPQPMSPQQMQQQMLSMFKYQFTFVNDYLTASQFKIQCTFADGSNSTAYINGATMNSNGSVTPSNPVIFPSNACLVGFVVSGSVPTGGSGSGVSGGSSQSFSVSHQNKNICSSTAFKIDPVQGGGSPYVQVNWTVGTNPYLVK